MARVCPIFKARLCGMGSNSRRRWGFRWNSLVVELRARRFPGLAPFCRWGRVFAFNLAVDSGVMTLEQVLHGVPLRTELSGNLLRIEVTGLEYDSRRWERGC